MKRIIVFLFVCFVLLFYSCQKRVDNTSPTQPEPTNTATQTNTHENTGTPTSTLTETFTCTNTITITLSSTAVITSTPTLTLSPTLTPSLTFTPTETPLIVDDFEDYDYYNNFGFEWTTGCIATGGPAGTCNTFRSLINDGAGGTSYAVSLTKPLSISLPS